jgi:hypothetical protein
LPGKENLHNNNLPIGMIHFKSSSKTKKTMSFDLNYFLRFYEESHSSILYEKIDLLLRYGSIQRPFDRLVSIGKSFVY